ncbi:(2Fe-2S)-binding protein [Streptomonospora sp. S1-112]|uniref:(2Fe-2S)-binding protein n=1 Tax=Streptomonospora mangrovi TaxID=2883123 RepID=A0A9X3NGU5_9ACTN|nr:(2Fe-2S)-binding protein [Streptomonospora mangrovi]MDA0563464.1 (2Fe-2S)-binding protein [Streptomonospora mangrovi]
MTHAALRRALDDAGGVNPFFAVPDAPDLQEWAPLPDLWRRPDRLAAEVHAVRVRLAAGRPLAVVEVRVAASLLFQSLASRLLSPAAATALSHGLLAPPHALRWRPAHPAGLALALDPGARPEELGRPRPQAAAEALARHVVAGALVPAADALRAQVRLAPRLLYGNAASSLAGTVLALAGARPRLAGDALALGRALLARPPLAGLGSFTATAASATAFTRTTCCLYYRLPGGGYCGDCAVAARRS